MKVLSRLKTLSSNTWIIPEDDEEFWYEDLPNFSINIFDYFLDCTDTKDAEKFIKDAEGKFEKFIKDEANALKDGKELPYIRGSEYKRKIEEFKLDLDSAKAKIALFNSFSLGDSVKDTFSKLKSVFKDKKVAQSYDFPDDFDEQYEKFYDKNDGLHTIKIDGALDFYLQFKDDKLINKYF